MMAQNLSGKEIDDIYATTSAVIWDRLPSEARQGVLRELSPNDRNAAALAIRRGRRVIRDNKQKNK
jgi:hypothetical protein